MYAFIQINNEWLVLNGLCMDVGNLWIKYSIWLRAFVMFSNNTIRTSIYYNSVIEKKSKSHLRSRIFVVVFSSWLNFASCSNFRQHRIGECYWCLCTFRSIVLHLDAWWVLYRWIDMKCKYKPLKTFRLIHKRIKFFHDKCMRNGNALEQNFHIAT